MAEEYSNLQRQLGTLIQMQREQTAKLNTFTQMQREQTMQLNALQAQFQQAKGALALLKWGLGISIGVATIIATFWDSIHRITGK